MESNWEPLKSPVHHRALDIEGYKVRGALNWSPSDSRCKFFLSGFRGHFWLAEMARRQSTEFCLLSNREQCDRAHNFLFIMSQTKNCLITLIFLQILKESWISSSECGRTSLETIVKVVPPISRGKSWTTIYWKAIKGPSKIPRTTLFWNPSHHIILK